MVSYKLGPDAVLRGHRVGVTALAHAYHLQKPLLFSGDEGGTILVWHLGNLRIIEPGFSQAFQSRVQSLRVIELLIGDEKTNILVAQSRDHGVKLLDLRNCETVASFFTKESLFSRGDAINIHDHKALLAYPSCLDSHLVQVRILTSNAATQTSGTAQRPGKKCNVFDIRIKKDVSHGHLLFVAYEDGSLCIFNVSTQELKIDFSKTFDTETRDFLSSFDILQPNKDETKDLLVICGSPSKQLLYLYDELGPDSKHKQEYVPLKRPGVSTISIHPANELVAVASWTSSVKLYLIKSRELWGTMDHHLKRVEDIVFVKSEQFENLGEFLMCCASADGTISLTGHIEDRTTKLEA